MGFQKRPIVQQTFRVDLGSFGPNVEENKDMIFLILTKQGKYYFEKAEFKDRANILEI